MASFYSLVFTKAEFRINDFDCSRRSMCKVVSSSLFKHQSKGETISLPAKRVEFYPNISCYASKPFTIEFSIFECLYFLVISVFLSSEIFVLTWLPTRTMTNRFSIPYLCNSFVTVTHDFNSSWKERTLDVTIWGSESVHTKCIC